MEIFLLTDHVFQACLQGFGKLDLGSARIWQIRFGKSETVSHEMINKAYSSKTLRSQNCIC